MMQEYRSEQAVNRGLGSKWKGVAAASGLMAGVAVVAAAVLQIVEAVH